MTNKEDISKALQADILAAIAKHYPDGVVPELYVVLSDKEEHWAYFLIKKLADAFALYAIESKPKRRPKPVKAVSKDQPFSEIYNAQWAKLDETYDGRLYNIAAREAEEEAFRRWKGQ